MIQTQFMYSQVKVLIFILFFFSCSNSKKRHHLLINYEAKVLVFLSPDCPLCRNYTKDLQEILSYYKDEIAIYGVVPGKHYSKFEVDSFLNYYNLPLEIIYDPNFSLVKDLGATITPEVFLIDDKNKIRYQGLIDNWLGELGRRRTVITELYLKDALESYLHGEEIKTKKTKAIGCFIE